MGTDYGIYLSQLKPGDVILVNDSLLEVTSILQPRKNIINMVELPVRFLGTSQVCHPLTFRSDTILPEQYKAFRRGIRISTRMINLDKVRETRDSFPGRPNLTMSEVNAQVKEGRS